MKKNRTTAKKEKREEVEGRTLEIQSTSPKGRRRERED